MPNPNPTSYTWNAQVNSKPFILDVIVVDAFTLRVIFNEGMVTEEATDTTNYTFTNGLVALQIVAQSASVYIVTTTQQAAGQSYTLTVSNVHDLNGNVI
jgi:hypothetical protein